MTQKRKITLMLVGCFIIISCWGRAHASQSDKSPELYVPQTKHSFESAFEGEPLSHTFEIINRGESELIIKKVTHS